jgi:ubiquinone/menaquinone biosynthesis C-methylase UbiE
MATIRQQCSVMGWLDSQLLSEMRVLPVIANEPSSGNWLHDVFDRFPIPRDGYWLSLGCGSAEQEIYAIEKDLCAHIDAYDISTESLEIARRSTHQKGITNIEFHVADLNVLELPKNSYDFVLMTMSLHHVSQLTHLLTQVQRTLRPAGWFIVNEYVGPAQFQFGDKQMQIVEELLSLLPDRLRLDSLTGDLKLSYKRYPRSYWNEVDPSEAIQSDRIKDLLYRYFAVIQQFDYGGTLLNPLLERIVANFEGMREADITVLKLLSYIELLAIREEILDNNFAIFIMRQREHWQRRPFTLHSRQYNIETLSVRTLAQFPISRIPTSVWDTTQILSQVQQMRNQWNIDSNMIIYSTRPLLGSWINRFQQFVRRVTWWFIEPILQQIRAFQLHTAQVVEILAENQETLLLELQRHTLPDAGEEVSSPNTTSRTVE